MLLKQKTFTPLTGSPRFPSDKDNKASGKATNETGPDKKIKKLLQLEFVLSLLLFMAMLYVTVTSQDIIFRELGKALAVFLCLNLLRVLSNSSKQIKNKLYEHNGSNKNN